METPPILPNPEPKVEPLKKKKSPIGCVSFAFAAISYALILILIILLALNNWTLDIYMYGGIIAVPILLVSSLIAFVLGIIGLLKKNEKKGMAILGIIPFTLGLLLVGVVLFRFRDSGPGKLPWKDDFKKEFWSLRSSDIAEKAIKYEALWVTVKKPNYDSWSNLDTEEDFSNVHLEVTATRVDTTMDTEMGIKCHTQLKTENSYIVMITSQGNYAIMLGIEDDSDKILSNNGEWANSGLIKKNENSYRIGMDCGNNAITLYVDGVKIDTVYDSTYSEGGIGLIVGSDNESEQTIVTFDDFLMKKLK